MWPNPNPNLNPGQNNGNSPFWSVSKLVEYVYGEGILSVSLSSMLRGMFR